MTDDLYTPGSDDATFLTYKATLLLIRRNSDSFTIGRVTLTDSPKLDARVLAKFLLTVLTGPEDDDFLYVVVSAVEVEVVRGTATPQVGWSAEGTYTGPSVDAAVATFTNEGSDAERWVLAASLDPKRAKAALMQEAERVFAEGDGQ